MTSYEAIANTLNRLCICVQGISPGGSIWKDIACNWNYWPLSRTWVDLLILQDWTSGGLSRSALILIFRRLSHSLTHSLQGRQWAMGLTPFSELVDAQICSCIHHQSLILTVTRTGNARQLAWVIPTCCSRLCNATSFLVLENLAELPCSPNCTMLPRAEARSLSVHIPLHCNVGITSGY